MTPSHTRLSAHRVMATIGSVMVLLGLTACAVTAVPGDADAGPTPTATATATPATADSTSDQDEISCSAFGDVQTILHNAQSAFYDGRMTQRELDGWSALATRVLGNITSADEGRVAAALASVKEAVPAVQAPLGPSNIISREWDAPGAELLAACEAAGFPVVTNGFIGG